MHPESENSHLIDPISTTELASPAQKMRATISFESQGRFESDMDSSYSQDIASSPSFGPSEDSIPALNLSGSPEPTNRRVSLLSSASIADSAPATPSSHLIEGTRVENDSDASPRYHRIHSTPYPKPRLPLQLTPHPQARVVSLPEWSRNRDPFLEAMRNLRSVSSPARFKRPPLLPLSTEEGSLEFSVSSQSAASVVSFPTLPEQASIGRSILSEQVSSLSAPREQFYTAPEGFFLTPPSFKSMPLSPITTGPERSLPQDRLLAPIREDESTCSAEPNSEDEVSLMLQPGALDTPSVYNRSSLSFSNTSRSSSPESVVFLSSIARISRSFLGGRTGHQSIPEVSLAHESLDETTHDSVAHVGGDGSQKCPSTETHIEHPKSPECTNERNIAQEQPEPKVDNNEELVTPTVSSPFVRNDSDWILFDPPRPIPALHGPPSLPYARCPSGAEGVALDDQQELGGIVWGLSEKDSRSRDPDEHRRVAASDGRQFMPETKEGRPSCTVRRGSKTFESTATALAFETLPSNGPCPLSTVVENTPSSSPNSKEKHVRFVENTHEGEFVSRGYRAPTVNTILGPTIGASEPNLPVGRDLTRILLDHVEKARVIESKPLQHLIPPASRQEILDQLRRFGVPFRPHGLPTPPNTVSPKFVSQFLPSDLSLAPSQLVQHRNPQPLAITHGPSLPKTFARATMQDKITTVPLEPRDTDIPTRATASAPSSLSNIKSVPLLKLRQRQHAEMDSWRKKDKPFGEVALSTRGEQVEIVCNVDEPSPCAANALQLNSTPCQVSSVRAITSSESTASASAKECSSLNSRRQRRAGKRAPKEAGAARSESPFKENQQTTGLKGNIGGDKLSRQTGHKKNQRIRNNSLPHNASRA